MVDSILQADIENLETNGFSAATLINDTKRAVNEIIAQNGVLSVVPITSGGTGASTALQARTNLSAALDQLSSSSSKGLMSAAQFNKLARLIETVPQSKAGAEVEFTTPAFYGSYAAPISSNITHDLVGAKAGVEVTIYHNDDVAPTFPTEWVLLGTGEYVTNTLNIIIARYIDSGRIEYVITQEA